ncbi:hypothetical protein [Bacillus wiedmannii]|uniref:Uncharacterized protein n=1 Tax=Bacillus wiedmannii TaxID=1890302 RepID=A0A2C4PYV6_9BACI|nr:hypothetical protein [Bacillus wiedmannii]PHD57719.1 hypothetical protein COF57_22890 [Bacillus wiedmannii]
MAFRTEEIKTYKTVVICDDCGKERTLRSTSTPLGFDGKMNSALSEGYTFKQEGIWFKNYCEDCKQKHK